MHLGDVNMEEADWVTLEARALELDAVHLRQSGDAVTLQAAMQRGARQVRHAGLQGVEAVV